MYSEELWEQWSEQEAKNYEERNGKKIYHKKGYLHLDQRFWFPEHKSFIQQILKSNLRTYNRVTNKYEYHSFSPFVKLLLKTPRYRYQFEEGHYDLETKIRPISFASHIDSLIWGYYSFALTKKYEEYIKAKQIDNCVLAYRTDLGKSNIQFAREVFERVKERKTCSAVALDIKGYFDHIDHIILKEKWQKILGTLLPEDQYRLLKIITRYSYFSASSVLKKYKGPAIRGERLPSTLMHIVPGKTIQEKFEKIRKDDLIVTNNIPNKKTKRLCGIPQGSPISALLSNVYLIDFDQDLNLKAQEESFIYRRYCDDILIICDTDRAYQLMSFVIEKILNEYLLKIQHSKVEITDFFENSKGKISSFKRQKKKIIVGKNLDTVVSALPVKITPANEQRFYKPLQYLGFEYDGKDIRIRSSSLSRYFRKLNYRLTRTVTMAHSPKSKSNQIFLKQIYERYTHLGKRNFLTYAYKASKKQYEEPSGTFKEGMDSTAISHQVARHLKLLKYELGQKNIKWFSHKQTLKKKVTPKYFK